MKKNTLIQLVFDQSDDYKLLNLLQAGNFNYITGTIGDTVGVMMDESEYNDLIDHLEQQANDGGVLASGFLGVLEPQRFKQPDTNLGLIEDINPSHNQDEVDDLPF